MVLLTWHNNRGNNVRSLVVNKVDGKWCTCHGMVVVAIIPYATKLQHGNIDYYNNLVRGKSLYCYVIDRQMYHLLLLRWVWEVLLLPCLATNNYGCNKPQQLGCQTKKICNTLLQHNILYPLATHMIWLQYVPFATKIRPIATFSHCCTRIKSQQ